LTVKVQQPVIQFSEFLNISQSMVQPSLRLGIDRSVIVITLVCTWFVFQTQCCKNKLIGVDDIALANIAELYHGKSVLFLSW